ncbi:hypothetical protein PIB30_053683 [Stylosanthes scabra]|uniref:Replication factor A C-terminal domain-containing protein n=1 Tax=Stylosanthes scabra TaxID=79078 RepID=A0ABU6VI38_9FABA|nr:hypothetical protein [Stylosanthes scabra]
MAHGDVASQQITQLDSHPEYSVGDELEGRTPPISSIGGGISVIGACLRTGAVRTRIVSVEVGAHDWSYLSCNNCPKKVKEVKNGYQCGRCHRILTDPPVRYRLSIIVADGTGCLNLVLWIQEGKVIIGQSANDVRAMHKTKGWNTQPKIFAELLEKLFLFKGMEQTVSNTLANMVCGEDDSDINAVCAVFLSQVMKLLKPPQSNFEEGVGTLVKAVKGDSIPSAQVTSIYTLDVQGSSSRTFHRSGGKRKSD